MSRILLGLILAAILGPFMGIDAQAADSVTKIVLPISRVKMQGYTALCWVYTTLSAVETNFLVRNPEATIDLSPSAMQFQTWKDRYLRRIQGKEDRLIEAGAAIDAISLIREHGLFPEESFPRTVKQWDREPLDPLSFNLSPFRSESLDALLVPIFGTLPQSIQSKSFSGSPQALAALILGDKPWKAYGVSKNGFVGADTHWDMDARKGTTATYLPLNDVLGLIRKSLEKGNALVVSFGSPTTNEGGHAVQVFGAEYRSDGAPILYHLKDSNQRDDPRQNVWSMDAEGFNSILRGITTIDLAG